MRVVIIGVGGVGAMAAWRLSKAGHEVIALDQFFPDHDRGSSYGDSRIIRHVYSDSLYTCLMRDAYALWGELQSNMQGEDIFRKLGGIFVGSKDHPAIRDAEQALSSNGAEYELLDSTEIQNRYPAFRMWKDEAAIFDPGMGYVRASKAVLAALELARLAGSQIIYNTTVTKIKKLIASRQIHITTSEGIEYVADRVILAAGAWTSRLLDQFTIRLPLKVTRQPYLHLKPDTRNEEFKAGRFPVWIDAAANMYGFPEIGNIPGIKIGSHDFGQSVNPEHVDRKISEADRKPILQYASSRFPWLGSEISYEKTCLYTVTPDEDFIIDTIPGLPEVLFISACSGHGFKFTPLLGQIAADFVGDAIIRHELSRFKASRFDLYV